MRLHDIYKNDIDRDINGVIKVAQDDETSIKQELVEYVITRELRRHFTTFLNNYEHSIDTPTDKMGVWISGFFGSGKSHFLKILSYLLSNELVAGKPAVEYFADKFDDKKMYAQLQRCASVPTDTILFNIDSKSPINKDATAILRVFAKVFYEHLGFYGNDLKVAKLEQFISKCGKMAEFKEEFENINGDTWENGDMFISSLLKTDKRLFFKSIKNTELFGLQASRISVESIIEFIINQETKIAIDDIITDLNDYFGLDISRFKVLRTVNDNPNFKYDDILGFFY